MPLPRTGTAPPARLILAFLLVFAAPAAAQTMTDHVMMGEKILLTGLVYSHGEWEDYWEGPLKRENGNIGVLTTESATWYADYGITDDFNLIAAVPYVWTESSQGTTSGFDDFQDLSLALKIRFYEKELGEDRGSIQSFLVTSLGTPITDYTPDLMPFSLGFQTTTLTGRGTVAWIRPDGWYGSGTLGWTLRDDVELDREFYFTNGQAFLTNKVEMPDVLDYSLTVGWQKQGLRIPFTWWKQDTRGGGDIRRQDMPFVSNDFDFGKVSLAAVYLLPNSPETMLRVEAMHTLEGRNVGKSTTLIAGLFRTIQF